MSWSISPAVAAGVWPREGRHCRPLQLLVLGWRGRARRGAGACAGRPRGRDADPHRARSARAAVAAAASDIRAVRAAAGERDPARPFGHHARQPLTGEHRLEPGCGRPASALARAGALRPAARARADDARARSGCARIGHLSDRRDVPCGRSVALARLRHAAVGVPAGADRRPDRRLGGRSRDSAQLRAG
jgi:hypothetical protein